MKKTLYITQETQDRLAKLGGPTPSANLRRAVALAECADELAKELEGMLRFVADLELQLFGEVGEPDVDASAALAKYKEAKK